MQHVLNKIDKMHQEINETSKSIDDKYKKVSYGLEYEQKNKQTINALLFRRLDDGEEPPKGIKVAFKDHKNKRYIIRVRRYHIVSGKDIYLVSTSIKDYTITLIIKRIAKNTQK